MKNSLSDFQERAGAKVEERDESWFYTQLLAHCKEVRDIGANWQILCPFHADSDPSCNVFKTNGMYKCFACGAGGGWNKLAAAIDADKLKRIDDDESHVNVIRNTMSRALSKAGLKRKREKEDIGKPLVEPWPEYEDVRGLPGKLLYKLGCVRVNDLVHSVLRLGLPVRNMHGQIYGYTCRAIDPADAEPKYVTLSADRENPREKEIPVKEAIFHVDMAVRRNWKRIVIVEGPLDALFLYQKKIPAVAILGTGSWTQQKVTTLASIGIEKAVVVMDNDKAGRKAKRKIVESLRPHMKVEGIKLPEGVGDPEDFTDAQFGWLKSKLLD